MKATRRTIAAAAGVSPSTVGMILSGLGERYNEETRARVLRTAAEMGYQPNINARAMRLRRSLLFGILLNDVNTHFASRFLQGVQESIEDTDYSPLVFFAKSAAAQLRNLARCRQRRVDGLLINCVIDPATGAAEAISGKLEESKIPAVEIFGHFLSGVPKVNIDNRQSGFLAARHLIELGHRRIALLTHSRYHVQTAHFDAWEQSCGYRDALHGAGLEPMIVDCELDFARVTEASFLQAGYDALDKLRSLPDAPTAVLC